MAAVKMNEQRYVCGEFLLFDGLGFSLCDLTELLANFSLHLIMKIGKVLQYIEKLI